MFSRYKEDRSYNIRKSAKKQREKGKRNKAKVKKEDKERKSEKIIKWRENGEGVKGKLFFLRKAKLKSKRKETSVKRGKKKKVLWKLEK